jgi:uncharacterized delta-60 repeat protein
VRLLSAPILAALSLGTLCLLSSGAASPQQSATNPAGDTLSIGSTGRDGDFRPVTNVTIDMRDHPDGIYHYKSVNIPAGVTVTFKANTTNAPVTWLVQDDVTIDGTVNLDGESFPPNADSLWLGLGTVGGPGGFPGGSCTGPGTGKPGDGPGGGQAGNRIPGGHGSFGTRGNSLQGRAASGEVYGDASLIPLVGGSGGGGGDYSGRAIRGAGGGGAILIATAGRIRVDGKIESRGGTTDGGFIYSHIGGNGSGGAIRLLATTVEGSGVLNVTRGPGTAFEQGGGDGRVRIDALRDNFQGTVNGVVTRGTNTVLGINSFSEDSATALKNLTLVGEWPGHQRGSAWQVEILNNLAFMAASSAGMVTFDVSDPSKPLWISSYVETHNALRLAVRGSLVFVGDNFGLHIVDVSVPQKPRPLGYYKVSGYISDVVLSGQYACVAIQDQGFLMIDISNPMKPTLIGRWDTTVNSHVNRLATLGTYAYVANGSGGLKIVDISDPVKPATKAQINTGGYAQIVATATSYAYVIDSEKGFQIVDVGDPLNPIAVGRYELSRNSIRSGIRISGNRAYVTEGSEGITIIDVGDPGFPKRIGRLLGGEPVLDVAVDEYYAYVSDAENGLQIINIRDPDRPVRVGSEPVGNAVTTGGRTVDLAVTGGFAYLADYSLGMQVIDVRNSTKPRRVAGYVTGVAERLIVSSGFAYVSDILSGVHVIDVTNPTNLVRIGGYDHSLGGFGGMVIDGRYGYLATAQNLEIRDVGIPQSLDQIGALQLGGWSLDIAYSNGYAFLANVELKQLQIVNVKNPSAPSNVGSIQIDRIAGVRVLGNYAYVAANGLYVINVSDPKRPAIFSRVETNRTMNSITLDSEYAYVAEGTNGIQVIDIRDPLRPRVVGQGRTSGYACDVVASDGYAFVAQETWGLGIFRILDGRGPHVLNEPENYLAVSGGMATFSVQAASAEELSFQWRKDSTNLVEGDRFLGVRTPNLTISSIKTTDVGAYSVIISNSAGAVTSRAAMLQVLEPPLIENLSPSLTAPIGGEAVFTVTATGSSPLAYEWRKVGGMLATNTRAMGVNSNTLIISNVQRFDGGDYQIVVTNAVGSAIRTVRPGGAIVGTAPKSLTVHTPLLDSRFAPRTSSDVSPAEGVVTVVGLGDERSLVGGDFARIDGVASRGVAVLASSGSYDSTFITGSGLSGIPGRATIARRSALQEDGKVLIGGEFSGYNGFVSSNLVRLNSNGAPDNLFDPKISDRVQALAIQNDGKILIGGWFNSVSGVARRYLARLTSDGLLDGGFTPNLTGQFVHALSIQSDGKILVGGNFTQINGTNRRNLARLLPSGALDGDFDSGSVLSDFVTTLCIQRDGKILTGGFFPGGLLRLNPDGSVDQAFWTAIGAAANARVWSVASFRDNRILVVGEFTQFNGRPRNRIAILDSNGMLDESVDLGSAANGPVKAAFVRNDRSVVIAGSFTSFDGVPLSGVAHLSMVTPTPSGTIPGALILLRPQIVAGQRLQAEIYAYPNISYTLESALNVTGPWVPGTPFSFQTEGLQPVTWPIGAGGSLYLRIKAEVTR